MKTFKVGDKVVFNEKRTKGFDLFRIGKGPFVVTSVVEVKKTQRNMHRQELTLDGVTLKFNGWWFNHD